MKGKKKRKKKKGRPFKYRVQTAQVTLEKYKIMKTHKRDFVCRRGIPSAEGHRHLGQVKKKKKKLLLKGGRDDFE